MADAQHLYHLAPAAVWAACKADSAPYFPSTYAQDGFTHLTADPALLLDVANHFYKGDGGDWIVLQLTAASLTAEVGTSTAARPPLHSAF